MNINSNTNSNFNAANNSNANSNFNTSNANTNSNQNSSNNSPNSKKQVVNEANEVKGIKDSNRKEQKDKTIPLYKTQLFKPYKLPSIKDFDFIIVDSLNDFNDLKLEIPVFSKDEILNQTKLPNEFSEAYWKKWIKTYIKVIVSY